MKKIIVVFLLILVLVASACDPPKFYHKDLSNEIESIQIINYNTDRNELTSNTFKGYSNWHESLKQFDFEKVEIIKDLPSENLNDFAFKLSKIFIVANSNFLIEPIGVSIMINFLDGSFEIISCYEKFGIMAIYDKNGFPIEFIGDMDPYIFNNLVDYCLNNS